MSQTANCVVCALPAQVWTGHVVARQFGYENILAGWCNAHITEDGETFFKLGTDGSAGYWTPEMGVMERPNE